MSVDIYATIMLLRVSFKLYNYKS